MILRLQHGKKQAFQEKLIKLSILHITEESLWAVSRLHNSSSFRPWAVIGDVAAGGKHGQFLQVVVTAQIKTVAVISCRTYQRWHVVRIVKTTAIYSHIADDVVVDNGLYTDAVSRCLFIAILFTDDALLFITLVFLLIEINFTIHLVNLFNMEVFHKLHLIVCSYLVTLDVKLLQLFIIFITPKGTHDAGILIAMKMAAVKSVSLDKLLANQMLNLPILYRRIYHITVSWLTQEVLKCRPYKGVA